MMQRGYPEAISVTVSHNRRSISLIVVGPCCSELAGGMKVSFFSQCNVYLAVSPREFFFGMPSDPQK